MTDRLKGCYVVFDRDIRDDDAEPILEAIRQLRGVLTVTKDVTNLSDYNARERVRLDLREKIWNALREDDEGRRR